MNDRLLNMFFQPHRWEAALEKGVLKDIDRAELVRLTNPKSRALICMAMQEGRYKVCPPHTADIKKNERDEQGKMKYRTVFINEPIDRIIMSIANDLFFELMADKVHPCCHSYQKGKSCNRTVTLDDGNNIIGHIFTIEKKKVFPEGVAWFPTNGRHYCEWKKASDVMKAMLAA